MIARIWHGMTRVEHHDAQWAFEAIRAAKYYSEDRDYLLEFGPTALHSHVTGRPE